MIPGGMTLGGQPSFRTVGVASVQLPSLLSKSRRRSKEVFDDIETAYKYPARSAPISKQELRRRTEYEALRSKYRRRLRRTQVFEGKVCKIYWYEEFLQSGDRLITIWFIEEIPSGPPSLLALIFGDD